MKARERLIREIKMNERAPGYEEDAAALRELDGLLALAEAYFSQDHAGKPETNDNCVECGILQKLRQAGYGEK